MVPPECRRRDPPRRGALRDARGRARSTRGSCGRRGGQAAQRLVGPLVGGEEALDPELVERDVVGRAEAGEDGEEAEARIATLELDGEERSRGRVDVERPPLTRNLGIGEELVEEAAGLAVAGAKQVAVEPLDERRRRGLPVDDRGP